ncbi:Cytochrome P450 94A1 [Apostasia shenzhenica]|uniref:noroxomaritidine synthase n=1 Tax=Apostasia shenzhenica TaxID=1088818 RepID=A0A2I0AHR9_9ASPA|nr:Cytochrome P450 94A1 [Apostasia shenzhenica]
MFFFFLLLLSSLPVAVFLLLHYGRSRRRALTSTCLKPYPLLGYLPQFIKNRHRFLQWITEVLTETPTQTMLMLLTPLSPSIVITANPANVEHILKTNFQNYPKGKRTISKLHDFLGDGIFNSDGEQWRWQRKAASFEFNTKSLRSFVVDTVLQEIAERLLPLLRCAAKERRTLDLQDILKRFGFDNICKVSFGEDPAGLANPEISEEQLRDIVISFIIAGRETTSSALTWFFWILATRPDVEGRILGEIRSVRGFSFEELREMQYLQAAVTESMRLYPPVPIDTLSCAGDDVMPDGTAVRKGDFVMYSAYTMGRLDEVWGKGCSDYRPERWLDEAGGFRAESPFRYPVFHAGPRACLGKEMAYLQMKSIVASVLERFQIELVGGSGKSPENVLSFTLTMKGGLIVRMRERSNF